jgi:hypothetical protein
MGLAYLFNKTLWYVMVENINSTILKVQESFGLTYMVGIISLNLRNDQGCATRTRAPPPPAGPGSGVAWRGGNLSVACLFFNCMRDPCPLAARLLACSMRPFSFSFPLREVK